MSEPAHRSPSGAYRLQLRAEFGFADAAEIADHLAALGVSHVYLSPILQAVPGSAHGYDVVDHSRISDDLGGEAAFRAMAARFRSRGLKVIVDVVPNHMAAPEPETLNRQFWSVLADGPASPYAAWFDVEGERIVLPVLGGPYEDSRGDLRPVDGQLHYFGHRFPLPDDHYRLAYWREGPNYRRFFEISTLIGLRVEEPEVFRQTHEVLLRLVREGLIDGLRIDHPDGLTDPRGYLRMLDRAAPGTWTVVEKILTGTEWLPADWPCAGTTGYDALGRVGGLFVDPAGEEPLTDAHRAFTGGQAGDHGPAVPAGEYGFARVEEAAKRDAVEGGLRPEVERLHRVLCRCLPSGDAQALRRVLVELLVAMPVYRAYVVPGEKAPRTSVEIIGQAVERAMTRLPAELGPELDAVARLALGEPGGSAEGSGGSAEGSGGAVPDARAEFAVRFQQTSAPLMAKGVEDTAFYRWSRLVALTEVGGDPSRFSVSPGGFHAYATRLAHDWPATMTTLSTHDTKRQEDVRARLAVLAELPERWRASVTGWRERAAAGYASRHGPERTGEHASPLEPDLEYLMWQTLVGAWPIDAGRLTEYLTKAMREAKTRTSWTDGDPGYERDVLDYARGVLADPALVTELSEFVAALEPYARVNTLGQKLVQLTMPGVPDVYQGCELTGLSLVDPDNRRPVDYAVRRERLARLDTGKPPQDLDDEKLLVTSRALRLRRSEPGWFGAGVGPDAGAAPYEPVLADGPAAAHVVAFRRGRALTVVTRLPHGLRRRGGWGETTLTVPGARYRDVLTDGVHHGPSLRLADVLDGLPVALLVEQAGP
ncbi:malto-oligosyltrehalose synthase [Actinomadura scrupuli]|uniref:malto-oligosyltrehalose synthase n=1 Tax=Actinomadura scrupuli TaxID=559629 RepID=UPI003D965B6C